MRTVIVIRRRTEVVQVNGEFVDGQTIVHWQIRRRTDNRSSIWREEIVNRNRILDLAGRNSK
jgi:hypothetical protein